LQFFVIPDDLPSGIELTDVDRFRVRYVNAKDFKSGVISQSVNAFSETPIQFGALRSLPDADRVADIKMHRSPHEADIIWRQIDDIHDKVEYITGFHYQVGGWPAPLQTTWMEADCEAALDKKPGSILDKLEQKSRRAIMAAQDDWVLLLQLCLDELKIVNSEWFDDGVLYFWGRKKDIERGQFDACWAIYQNT
jgi:Uncharacterized protein conserved in bacteria